MGVEEGALKMTSWGAKRWGGAQTGGGHPPLVPETTRGPQRRRAVPGRTAGKCRVPGRTAGADGQLSAP